MIRVENIKKSFDDEALLHDISFSVNKGERLAIVGPGGCGKTTAIKILLGLVPPDQGSAFLFDTKMSGDDNLDEKEVTLQSVGMAFQQGGLFDFMTVRDNLMFAMEHMTTKSSSQREHDLKKVLKGVKLPHTENLYPHELSGGMQRRVGIARALCTDPKIAIFDEPTSGLDPVTSTIILNMISELGSNGNEAAMLVVTSNVEIAIRFADRILVIHEGRVAADGAWRDLLLEASDWVKHFLSVRLVGLDVEYAYELDLPKPFIEKHWQL